MNNEIEIIKNMNEINKFIYLNRELLKVLISVLGTLLASIIGISLTNRYHNKKDKEKGELETKVSEYLMLNDIEENMEKLETIYKKILKEFSYTLKIREKEYKEAFKCNVEVTKKLSDVINTYQGKFDFIDQLIKENYKKETVQNKEKLEYGINEKMILKIFDAFCIDIFSNYNLIYYKSSLSIKDDEEMKEIIYSLTRKLTYNEISILDNFNRQFRKIDNLSKNKDEFLRSGKDILKIKEILNHILSIKIYYETEAVKKILQKLENDLK